MIRRNELTTQQSSNGAVITVIYRFWGENAVKEQGTGNVVGEDYNLTEKYENGNSDH